jgi:hypothetical protein
MLFFLLQTFCKYARIVSTFSKTFFSRRFLRQRPLALCIFFFIIIIIKKYARPAPVNRLMGSYGRLQ